MMLFDAFITSDYNITECMRPVLSLSYWFYAICNQQCVGIRASATAVLHVVLTVAGAGKAV